VHLKEPSLGGELRLTLVDFTCGWVDWAAYLVTPNRCLREDCLGNPTGGPNWGEVPCSLTLDDNPP